MVRGLEQLFSVLYSFPVLFTRGVFTLANPCLAQALRLERPETAVKVACFLDAGVDAAWPELSGRILDKLRSLPQVEAVGGVEVVPGGERAKDGFAVVERVGRKASDLGLDRHSFVLAVGGGALLDAVGLGASLVHRGLRLLRLPTTVLAQDDAGIGVKNGVNACGQKNFFGSFAVPWAVINDLDFLRTLPPRHVRAGVAEAIKVACIKDAAFFAFLEGAAGRLAAGETELLERVVYDCARLHLEHTRTGGDPFESGSARPLDFGHWSAHWLEMASGGGVTHGEGVATGIAIDVFYAAAKGLVPRPQARRVVSCLRTCGFDLPQPLLDERDAGGRRKVFAGLERFREHLGGRLTLVLPAPLGSSREVHEVDLALMDDCIGQVQAL